MKKIILFFGIFILFINITYALPIGILALGSDFFILFFGFIISVFSAIFFYFKNLKLCYKILILILILLSFFPIRYFYLEYKKQKILDKYIENIKKIGLYDLYYDSNGFLFNNYDKNISVEELRNKFNKYYLLDIRERSELFGLNKDYSFKHVRFPNLIKNYKELLKNIKKPILVTCLDGHRGKIVSSFLGNLGYNSYYLKGGLRQLGIDYGNRTNEINYCKNNIGKKIFVGINDNKKETLDIPYMQLTENDIKSIINYFEKNNILNKSDKIILFCSKNKGLNCGVGRQSFGLLLQDLGYKNICLGKK